MTTPENELREVMALLPAADDAEKRLEDATVEQMHDPDYEWGDKSVDDLADAAVNFIRTHGPALLARLEQDAADAGRYGYLCQNSYAVRHDGRFYWDLSVYVDGDSFADLDAGIDALRDAALAQDGKGGVVSAGGGAYGDG